MRALNLMLIVDYAIWRAKYAQPITGCNYSDLVPDYRMPINNCFLCTMAQIYPEDRGTNYAIREGRKVARIILDEQPA